MTGKEVMIWLGISFAILFAFGFINVSAEQQTLGIFKQNSDVVLTQLCNNCTYNNISYVSYPNMTYAISNVEMTKDGVSYSYTFLSNYTQELGRYIVCGFGDNDGSITTWCYDFSINGTGRASPEGAVLTFFIIAFLLILLTLTYLFIHSLGHGWKKDFDLVDLAMDFGIYFMLIGFYVLQKEYLGSPMMTSILDVLVYVGAFTHIFIASLMFVISMMAAAMAKKNFVQSGGME